MESRSRWGGEGRGSRLCWGGEGRGSRLIKGWGWGRVEWRESRLSKGRQKESNEWERDNVTDEEN